MSHKQKIKKQKKIIIISAVILLLLLISAILTVTVLYFQNKNIELSQEETNILYYNEGESEEGEKKEEEGEDDILVVGLEENNQTNEENKTNENSGDKKQEVDAPYYIKVNNQANVVTIYKKDTSGKYTVPVKAMLCSVGTATPTSGVYKMSDKYAWRLLQGDVYGQYACRITGHILFHSVPYEEKDKSTLEWWEYDKLGTIASLGCIRLTVEDAKWIYDNCIAGTKVEFYSSSNPGPLGKPTARKISEDEEVRNWDPTDPDTNNPWKEYLKKKEEASKTQETTAKPTENSITNNVVQDRKEENNIVTTIQNVVISNENAVNKVTTNNTVKTENSVENNV